MVEPLPAFLADCAERSVTMVAAAAGETNGRRTGIDRRWHMAALVRVGIVRISWFADGIHVGQY